MAKKILKMLIRILIICVLLYGSYYMYTHYTGFAIQMMNEQKIFISLIVHSLIFLFMGIALRFEPDIINAIKNKSIKVNFVKLGAAVIFLVILLALPNTRFFYLHLSCFVALATGFFLTESFEYESNI